MTKMELYTKIEEERCSKVLVYVTGDKQGMQTQIARDSDSFFIEHLDKIGVVKKITLILQTNGGDTLAGWNLVNLIRQFCDEFEVIVPLRAMSTGTLICLGADQIMMTKQATLGPIDPSINGPLNPKHDGTNQQLPVSVEDIKGYLELAKDELKMKDDQALAAIFSQLSQKVHPLVLGKTYRAIGQIKMLADKLLTKQVPDKIRRERIIDFLCSGSGSHDFSINRREAQNDLGLKIEKPTQEFYLLLKEFMKIINECLDQIGPFNPQLILVNSSDGSILSEAAYTINRAMIESIPGGSDFFISEGKVKLIPGIPVQIQDNRLFEGWRHFDEIRDK